MNGKKEEATSPLFQCNGRYFLAPAKEPLVLTLVEHPTPKSPPALLHSKVYQHNYMQIQVHIASGIKESGMARMIVEKMRSSAALPSPKAQPYAIRIKALDTDVVIEEDRDKGFVGAGNKLLRVLRRRKITGVVLSVSIWYTIIPLNYTADHYPIVNAVNNFLDSHVDEHLRPRISRKTFQSNEPRSNKALALLPTLCFTSKKIVFKNPNKSLVSKVLNLSMLEAQAKSHADSSNGNRDQIKRFLRRISKRDLMILKTAKKMPPPFVVRVFQLFMAVKGERAEKWSEIQESIKPLSFKAELWKLSHRRIDPFKLQFLNKLLLESAELNNTSEDFALLHPLATVLLEWIRWVLEKESRGKKAGRGLRFNALLSNVGTPITAQNSVIPKGRNSATRRNLTMDVYCGKVPSTIYSKRYVTRLRSRDFGGTEDAKGMQVPNSFFY